MRSLPKHNDQRLHGILTCIFPVAGSLWSWQAEESSLYRSAMSKEVVVSAGFTDSERKRSSRIIHRCCRSTFRTAHFSNHYRFESFLFDVDAE